MLTQALIVACIIVVLFVIAGVKESSRERALRAWASSHQGAQLIWPFVPGDRPEIPVNSMIELFLSRPPIGLASAMHVAGADDEILFVEFRTTPLGRDSSHWFTLVAHRGQNGVKWRPVNGERARGDSRVLTHGPWTCQRVDGLMSVGLLDEAHGSGSKRGLPA